MSKKQPATPEAQNQPYIPYPIIGFDAEYTLDPANPDRNVLLSIQWCVIDPDGRSTTGIWYSPDGKRLKFVEWIVLAIQDAMAKRLFKHWPKHVNACAHFSAAEFSMFADRDKLGKKLSLLRGTFANLGYPMKLSRSVDGHLRKFDVVLSDTMLLSPAKKGALKDLGEILGLPKLAISKADLDDMRAFLKRD